MNETQANAIFDILVEHAGAQEWMRGHFVWHHRDDRCDEFRFQGSLGFGGKFWHRRWAVDAYPEDITPERQRVIAITNAALAEFDRRLPGAAPVPRLPSDVDPEDIA